MDSAKRSSKNGTLVLPFATSASATLEVSVLAKPEVEVHPMSLTLLRDDPVSLVLRGEGEGKGAQIFFFFKFPALL